jgi:MATE family multidrug resistance protein
MEKHPSAPDTPPLISSPDSTTPPPPNPSNGGIRELFHLAYPMVLSMISWTVMGFVDSAMVGRLGATELAAVGFSGIWLMIAFAMLHGTTMSLQTFVSQSDGAGEHERCGAWTWQSLSAVAPGTLVAIAGLALFLRPFLGQLGISPELESTAVEYVRPRLVGEFAWVATFAFMSFFRGVGDMRTPLYVGVAANLVNVVLDYGLIFGELGMPEWGIWGAGVATAASDWFALIVIFVAFRRRSVDERYHTGFVRPRLDEIRRLLRLGAPIGGQMLLGESSYAVFSIFIARMGDVEMAVSQALVILLSLTFMQAHGIGGAAATLVGRYVGARDEDGVLRSFHSALKLAAFVAVTVGLLSCWRRSPSCACSRRIRK